MQRPFFHSFFHFQLGTAQRLAVFRAIYIIWFLRNPAFASFIYMRKMVGGAKHAAL